MVTHKCGEGNHRSSSVSFHRKAYKARTKKLINLDQPACMQPAKQHAPAQLAIVNRHFLAKAACVVRHQWGWLQAQTYKLWGYPGNLTSTRRYMQIGISYLQC